MSIRMGPGRFQFAVDANQTGSQANLRCAAMAWVMMWDMLSTTGWTPGPLASSPRCQVTLFVSVGPDCGQRAFQGSSSSIRLILWSAMRARVSASQAWGSTPLSFAVSISV